jgi:subtilisin family serine protease
MLTVDFALAQEYAPEDYVPGEVIVKLKGSPHATQSVKFQGKVKSKLSLKKSFTAMNVHHYKVGTAQSVEEMITELENDPAVEFAEPNYYVIKASAGEQGQEYTLGEVQSLGGEGAFALTGAPIQAMEAWDELSGTETPLVAIIDTGVDVFHEALQGAVWVNPNEIPQNGLDDDGNGFVDDIYGWNFHENNNMPTDCDGHGTHVAGIIRGVGQDITASPVDDALINIMALKFLDCVGNGTTADAISAIYYAVDNGAKVINNSWGGGNYSRSLHEAIVYSYNNDVVFVAAAGNSGTNNDDAPLYPASYDVPNIISVAATNDSDQLAAFSNYGVRTVHIAAPGVSILSTYPGGIFTTLSGTSMAAPFVSGIAALMIRERPTVIGYELKQVMLGAADIQPNLVNDVLSSARINELNSITAIQSASLTNYKPAYSMKPSTEDRSLASNIASSGASCGLVKKMVNSGRGGGGPSASALVFFAIVLSPLLVIGFMRDRKRKARRRHDRYMLNSTIAMNVDGEEIEASLSTISLGGAGVDAAVWLNKGSTVSLKIESPDGKGSIEVQGRVVWSRKSQRYGIEFDETEQSTLEQIAQWTKSLVKA